MAVNCCCDWQDHVAHNVPRLLLCMKLVYVASLNLPFSDKERSLGKDLKLYFYPKMEKQVLLTPSLDRSQMWNYLSRMDYLQKQSMLTDQGTLLALHDWSMVTTLQEESWVKRFSSLALDRMKSYVFGRTQQTVFHWQFFWQKIIINDLPRAVKNANVLMSADDQITGVKWDDLWSDQINHLVSMLGKGFVIALNVVHTSHLLLWLTFWEASEKYFAGQSSQFRSSLFFPWRCVRAA